MRASWVNGPVMGHILAAMLPENRLAVEVSEATGLRISDVLALKTEQVRRTARPTVIESKTGKHRRIYLPAELRYRMLAQAGTVWVWPGRLDPDGAHRTRQAVYKDMQIAVKAYRRAHTITGEHPSPHTARKRAAVKAYQRGGIDAARALLSHSDQDTAVTLLYALSDQMQPPKRRKGGGRKKVHQ